VATGPFVTIGRADSPPIRAGRRRTPRRKAPSPAVQEREAGPAHAHAAVLHGASPQKAAEVIGVTFLMNGGPATVYGPRVFAAFQEFYGQLVGQPDGHLPAG
jgi:hypothetical protein